MRVAILDLGTNTFNLLVSSIDTNKTTTLERAREIVKLGEGGLEHNIIAPTAYNRGINAIGNHLKRIKKHNCRNIKAVATSGIRSTENGKHFLSDLKSTFDLTVEIIDGSREAELIWKGVSLCYPINKQTLIMDIGGGSTEFIIADESGVLWKKSFKLGASRLIEIFKPNDPISAIDINVLHAHFDTVLQPLKQQLHHYPCSTLLGSSGSFDTLCDMYLHRNDMADEFDKKNAHNIDMLGFEDSFEFIMTSTKSERLNTPGILPMRADMIVVSALLTQYIIKTANITDMHVSKFALKEGLLSEFLD